MLHINCNVCILLQPLEITTVVYVTAISYVIKIYTYHSQEHIPNDIGVLKFWPYFAVEILDFGKVHNSNALGNNFNR